MELFGIVAVFITIAVGIAVISLRLNQIDERIVQISRTVGQEFNYVVKNLPVYQEKKPLESPNEATKEIDDKEYFELTEQLMRTPDSLKIEIETDRQAPFGFNTR